MFATKSFISYTLLTVFAVDLLATSGDITMTWSSPIYPKLYSNDSNENPLGRPITEEEDGWLGSLINIGAIIGPLPFGFISEKFGRKIGLLSIAIPHIISYLTMAFATNINLFYFGRVFGGLAVGGGYTLLPTYIAEISEDSYRGMYSVTLGIFWAFGNFIPYGIGPFMSIKAFHFVLTCFPTAFFICFLIIGVETPYYLVAKNKIKEAERVLMRLRSGTEKEVEVELWHIRDTLEHETHGNIKDIFKQSGLRKGFFISMMLVVFQQISGWNSFTFYLQPIFDASDTKIPSDISSVIVGLCIFSFSTIIPFIIEKFGRKPLHIFSCFGMCIALVLMGGFFYVKDDTNCSTEDIFWLPLFSLIFAIFSFQMGMSVIPWTVSSELVPKNLKHISAPFVSSMCWIFSFLMTKYFHNLTDLLGMAGAFWFFSSMCILDGLFTIFLVPETKGKSFLEIQKMLRRRISFIAETDK